MKKLSLRNKISKYIHKSFQKWPFFVQVVSKAQQPPRSPIKGHFWRREYGPSNCTSRSQRKPSSENIPPRRQLQIQSHKSFDQRELRPSQNYVTPLHGIEKHPLAGTELPAWGLPAMYRSAWAVWRTVASPRNVRIVIYNPCSCCFSMLRSVDT